jgi:Domain of unknown function (DUF3291)
MSSYLLAQLNIARLLAPLDSPRLADFVDNLDRINALAESSPGFVWRLKDDDGDATAIRPLGEDVIVNMSVWEDLNALNQYVYRSAHVEVMRRRREWFERGVEAHLVLWWVRKGHIPTLEEAIARQALLREKGPTPDAFTFRTRFDAPDAIERSGTDGLLVECPG